MRFTEKHLQDLKSKGLIRGYEMPEKKKSQEPKGKIVSKHFNRGDKKKDFISWFLLDWCSKQAVQLFEEYKFDETGERKFKFDYAIPEIKLAVEYEGGLLNPRSGHRSVQGINRDVTKYNLAALQGWTVIRLTAENYKTLPQALKKYEK